MRIKYILYFVEIAVAFNYILLVILIHCFRAIIPQAVVDNFYYYYYIIIIREIPYEPTRKIGRMTNLYSFLYICSPRCPGPAGIAKYRQYRLGTRERDVTMYICTNASGYIYMNFHDLYSIGIRHRD